ncbi:MAG: glycoside hydrolase family 95 protein, partial [Muribaculaceae bacterium]|nr:glycoside hydrolase family 95 protein [Muribaculaceae bacterium]
GEQNMLNAWGGIEAGNYIGLWKVNDTNNGFEFINEKSMRFGDFKVIGSTTWRPESRHTLWYTTPATLTGAGNIWMEYSLPLGNGQLGASMFNGVSRDQLLINDKALWSGSPTSYGYFLNFGSIYVDMLDEAGFGQSEEDAAINYYRALDLTTATGVSGFSTADGSVNYKREYIVSNPDGVVAMHISADQPGKIFQTYTLDSKPGLSATTKYEDGEAYYYGSLETVKYSCRMKVIPTGGTITTDANGGITVKGADEVLVILRAATDFDNHKATYTTGVTVAQLHNAVKDAVDAAAAKGWESLLADHVADHQKYYNRVNFNIGGAENNIPTNELVDEYNKTTATDVHKMLEELYFSYGRYLEIASSRGVDLPSNLQGIWNNVAQAPWHSDIHANINVQMNYWPAESTNLSEMHMPFLNYITTMAESNEWKKNARNAGQTIGWTCYTENNIFGGGSTYAMNYVIANAWYCSHLWQHYCYTLDKEYLAKAFPAMWSCTLFWTERMILEAATDTYVCTNEFSPEQNGINENGVPHAQQILAYLFDTTLE